jgi:hypothetical protein
MRCCTSSAMAWEEVTCCCCTACSAQRSAWLMLSALARDSGDRRALRLQAVQMIGSASSVVTEHLIARQLKAD